jgi:dipeptidyl aminopeptidase/acylaminoacyl peptidase
MGADGSNQVRLTNNPSGDGAPAWSPDGTRIAFTTTRDGNNEIYVMDAADCDGDGNGDTLTNITNNPATDWLPDWGTAAGPGVTNCPPIAGAGGPYSAPEGGSVSLSGLGSDPDSGTLTYVWDLDNNGTFETAGQNPSFSAAGRDGPSSQPVVLQVCDNQNACATSTGTVNITNVEPTVNAGADTTINEGNTFSSSGSFTDPGTDTWTATVNYGDGSGVQPLTLVGKTFSFSHT